MINHGDAHPEINTSIDDADLNDTSIRDRVAYDGFVRVGQGDASFEASDDEFARFVRLMHDTLNPTVALGPNNSQSKDVATDRPTLKNPFGRFENPRLIGIGSFGSVWRATDPLLQRDVAIKVPHPEVRMDTQLSNRFLREARAVARLNHPSIVRVHEAGLIDGVPYMASEYVAGETLSDRLRREKQLSPLIAARMVAQLADAAAHAHRGGVLHRDIKPDNVLLQLVGDTGDDSDVVARLTDFGLARLIDDDTDHSRAGLLVGTPNYMAPEQISGAPSSRDVSVDIYALGVLLYEMIAGTLPRDTNGSVQALLHKSHHVKPPRRERADVPRDLDAICMHCLEVNPADRYRSAAMLSDDLIHFIDGRPIQVRPMRALESMLRWSRSHRTATAVMSTVFLALCIISALTWRSSVEAEHNNELLRIALASGDRARLSAIVSEQRYREISWNTGIQHAYRLYDESDFLSTQRMLDRLAVSHTDASSKPEWSLLRSELANHFRLLHHWDVPLRDVVSVPGTDRIAIVGDSEYVDLIDVADGKVCDRIPTTIKQLHALDINPRGNVLVIGGATNILDRAVPMLVNLDSPERSPAPIAGPTTIESIAFSKDGKHLATGFRYEGVAITPVSIDGPDNGSKAIRIDGDRRNLSLQWTLDGNLIFQKDFETLEIAKVDGTILSVVERKDGFQVFAAFRNDRRMVASFYNIHDLQVIDIDRNETQFLLTGATHQCSSLSVSDDGQWVAAGQADGQVVVWQIPAADTRADSGANLTNNQIPPTAKVQLHEGSVTGLCWHGSFVVSVGEDGSVVRSKYAGYRTEASDPSPAATAARFLPHSSDLLIGFLDGEVWRVDARRLRAVSGENRLADIQESCRNYGRQIMSRSGIEITAVAVADDASKFSVGRADGSLSVVRADDGVVSFSKPSQASAEAVNAVNQIAFGPAGNLIFWTAADKYLRGEFLDGSSPSVQQETFSAPECVRVSAAGDTIAASGLFEGIRLYRIRDNKPSERTIGINSNPVFDYTSDGDHLIAGCRDGTIRVYSILTEEQQLVLKPHLSQVCGLCCSRNGKFGMSIDVESNVYVWNHSSALIYGRLQRPPSWAAEHLNFRGSTIVSDDESLLLTLMIRKFGDITDSRLLLFELR